MEELDQYIDEFDSVKDHYEIAKIKEKEGKISNLSEISEPDEDGIIGEMFDFEANNNGRNIQGRVYYDPPTEDIVVTLNTGNTMEEDVFSPMEFSKIIDSLYEYGSNFAKGGITDEKRERVIDYFINNEEDEYLIDLMGENGEDLLDDRSKNYDEIYKRISDNNNNEDIEYYFKKYLDDGSGMGHLAKGGYVNQYFGKGYENDAIIELKKALPNHTFEKGNNRIIVDDGKFIIFTDEGRYGFIRTYSNEGSEGGIGVEKIDDAIEVIEGKNFYAKGGKINSDLYDLVWDIKDTKGNIVKIPKTYSEEEIINEIDSFNDKNDEWQISEEIDENKTHYIISGYNEEEYGKGGQIKDLREYFDKYDNYNYGYGVNENKDKTYTLEITYSGKRGYPRDAEIKAMRKQRPNLPQGYEYINTKPEWYNGSPMTIESINELDEYYDDRGYTEYEFYGTAYHRFKKSKASKKTKPVGFKFDFFIPKKMAIKELVEAGFIKDDIEDVEGEDSVIIYNLNKENAPLTTSIYGVLEVEDAVVYEKKNGKWQMLDIDYDYFAKGGQVSKDEMKSDIIKIKKSRYFSQPFAIQLYKNGTIQMVTNKDMFSTNSTLEQIKGLNYKYDLELIEKYEKGQNPKLPEKIIYPIGYKDELVALKEFYGKDYWLYRLTPNESKKMATGGEIEHKVMSYHLQAGDKIFDPRDSYPKLWGEKPKKNIKPKKIESLDKFHEYTGIWFEDGSYTRIGNPFHNIILIAPKEFDAEKRRINRKFEKGGKVRTLSKGDSVLYQDKTWYVTEKNGAVGIVSYQQGAWGSDYPFIPLTKIIQEDELSDMYGNKVFIPYSFEKYEKGGQIDYFEQYDKLPSKPRKIVEKYQEKMEEGDYDFKDSADFLKEMEAEGYTFEYGLDNEPYDLHKMAKGGKLQTIDFNDFKDKLIILRVTPPSQGGPGGNPGGDPGKEEVNVKNPFEKDKKQPKEKPDKDKKGKDNKGKEKPGGDDKGKDKAGEDDKGKDKKGKDKKGKAKNKPDEDNSTRGKPQKGFESQSEDEENTKLNLSKLEEALGTSDIKKTFRNRTNVEIALTGKKVFDTDNDKKISESLDKIFK